VGALVAAWEGSALAARMEAAGAVLHELPFAFVEDDVVLRGSLDICARRPDGSLLVADLKTTALAGRDPAAVVESEYALQRSIYALAALRSGAPAAEIAFSFLERPEAPVTHRFTAEDADGLAAEVRAAIGRLRTSAFTARAGDHCATCPALDRLCPAPGWHGREAG
jgi:ATP-dependent helicase/nuclease subunit A